MPTPSTAIFNGFTPGDVVRQIGGQVPPLNSYGLVTASVSQTARIELYDRGGLLLWQGTITVTTTPTQLLALVTAVDSTCTTALLNTVAGAKIAPLSGNIYAATSYDPIVGAFRTNWAGTSLAPSSTSLIVWGTGTIYNVGCVA